ncbi:MAG TPA: hypothetical protein VFC53_13740 [Dehalococcoidia bacterium]|nr:hypothetical protein [Dehalococcoidia bacterium]
MKYAVALTVLGLAFVACSNSDSGNNATATSTRVPDLLVTQQGKDWLLTLKPSVDAADYERALGWCAALRKSRDDATGDEAADFDLILYGVCEPMQSGNAARAQGGLSLLSAVLDIHSR